MSFFLYCVKGKLTSNRGVEKEESEAETESAHLRMNQEPSRLAECYVDTTNLAMLRRHIQLCCMPNQTTNSLF
jgi:hypothetical protein